MRTTLNIDDEALELIRKYAEERSITLSQAASDLVHRGSRAIPKFKMKNGWPQIELPPGSPPSTTEMVKQWEREYEEEEIRRALSPRR